MQITLKIRKDGILEFPLNYNYQLQSAIYHLLAHEKDYAEFLHDYGYGQDKTFRMFTFGTPKGQYEIVNKKICFHEGFTWQIRSVSQKFCEIIQNAITQRETIKLFDYVCDIQEMTVTSENIPSTSVIIRSHSPIVIKNTTQNEKTIYYSPTDREFYSLIQTNFHHKYMAYYGKPSLTDIALLPLGNVRKVVTSYKNTWITAYHGQFELHGSLSALNFLYDTGLGVKNAQGFGMFEINA